VENTELKTGGASETTQKRNISLFCSCSSGHQIYGWCFFDAAHLF